MMEQQNEFNTVNRSSLRIGFMNIRGQSGLQIRKQVQIEAFVRRHDCDILHLQEANIESETFSSCDFISSNYNIFSNNSVSKYGTASLVKSGLMVENVRCDTEGRVIIFNIGQLTFTNIYLHSGTDGQSRAGRERICSEVLPNLLINSKLTGCAGGDFNCINDKKDATNHPEAKMSRCLQRLVKVNNWSDSYRAVHPTTLAYSRYYENTRAEGASRIDRCYHYGDMVVEEAQYLPVAFSDHFAHLIKFSLPNNLAKIVSPKCRPSFRMRAEVIKDAVFKERLAEAMQRWGRVRQFQGREGGSGTLQWWDLLVKPGIKKIALNRTKEINIGKNEEMNFLLIRQAYLTMKIQKGETNKLGDLQAVHYLIESWYQKESEKVQHQSKVDEFQKNEKTTIYHHELHKKVMKKSSILKLDTGLGIIEGHAACSNFLEKTVEDLLSYPASLNLMAQEILLDEVEPVFTENDNELFLTPPSKEEVWKTVCDSNLNAAPGTDGIPSLFYKECWDLMGDPLTDVMKQVFNGNELPLSMRTSLMVFGSKPKKPGSILAKDKRRISLLNSDFKTATGLEARKFKKSATHTLSHLQLVAGDDRRIHHGINLARNAIYAAGRPGHPGCGILDTDLIAAFDWMCLDWVYMVLEKKGLNKKVTERLRNLYRDSVSVVVVNNVHGKAVRNVRLSLRQGDLPSMNLFGYGIDPLLSYLNKRLKGILISSLPVHGPLPFMSPPLLPLEERYKVIGYADDVKPAVTTMEEFKMVDKAMALFEGASGCKLHRDPANKKCKFLPLARWRGTLDQADIPCAYMTISDHLEMVGVELRATWTQTRKANGEAIQARVANTVSLWKTGKFMHFSMRSWSLNQHCYSKVWFRTHSVDLRLGDIKKITSSAKSWMYADMLLKPEEKVMHRPVNSGGLGVLHVHMKALAGLIRTFLETACNPKFRHSMYHEMLFRYHVLEDKSFPNPGFPPFYNEEFFNTIRQVHLDSPLNVATMTEGQWYRLLLEDKVTMEHTDGGRMKLIPCRVELANPDLDWEVIWRRVRLPGLGSEITSFLLKMMHQLLPTQERVARISDAVTGFCMVQGCVGEQSEDVMHALVTCAGNGGVGRSVLDCVAAHIGVGGMTDEQAIRLHFVCEDSNELPMVWFLAVAWTSMWETRMAGKRPELYRVRADLEAKVSLLRKTRHFKADAEEITIMINNMQ